MATISQTRRVLAVVAVTTALCADQMAVAAPAARPERVEIGMMASRLVSRLAQNFQRVLPAAICRPAIPGESAPATDALPVFNPGAIEHQPISPFQFRLPPPAV